MAELIGAFSIERVGKSGTKFDINKAKWFNQQYIKSKSDDELGIYLSDALSKMNISTDAIKAAKIAGLMKDRIVIPKDLGNEALYFFVAPTTYETEVVASKWTEEAVKVIKDYKVEIQGLVDFNAETAKSCFNEVLIKHETKMGKVFQALRLAVTGHGHGPDLMLIMEILGKEEVIERLNKALIIL